MNEVDDRLAGDTVWELFAHPGGESSSESWRAFFEKWLVLAGVIALVWLLSPSVAVAIACAGVASREIRRGWLLTRSMPNKAGGIICSRFSYAWGAWKFGAAGFVLMLASIALLAFMKDAKEPPPGFLAAMLLGLSGFIVSAGFTAAGLVAAFRSGMRVWIGEGVNQARTLLLAMLIVGFMVVVVVPICVWMVRLSQRHGDNQGLGLLALAILMLSNFVGPVVILLVLDWLSRQVIADRPGKFGPKVSTVGKWDA